MHAPLPAPADLATAERVLVIGSSAAGKSTLARALGARLDLPVVELDALFWGPGWRPRPEPEFRSLVAQSTAGSRWIVEGNYAMVRDLLWPRAAAVIWLDYSLGVVLRRGLWRTLRRGLMRTPLWHGNRESLRRAFLSRESILLWILSTHRQRRVTFGRMQQSGEWPHLHWTRLRRPAEATRLVRALDRWGDA